MNFIEQAMQRFEEFTERDQDGCLLWKGPMRGGQPARIEIGGVRKYPRRLALELFTDQVLPSSKWWLRTKCGKCSCVSPRCIVAKRPNGSLSECEREEIKSAIEVMRCEKSGRYFHSLNDLAEFFKRTLGVSTSTVYRLAREVRL